MSWDSPAQAGAGRCDGPLPQIHVLGALITAVGAARTVRAQEQLVSHRSLSLSSPSLPLSRLSHRTLSTHTTQGPSPVSDDPGRGSGTAVAVAASCVQGRAAPSARRHAPDDSDRQRRPASDLHSSSPARQQMAVSCRTAERRGS